MHCGSLTWLLAEGLRSLPHERLWRATEDVFRLGQLASPGVSNGRESKMEAVASFMTSEVTHGHFYSILLGTQLSSI